MEERSQKGADDQRQNEFSVTYAGKEKDEIHRIQENQADGYGKRQCAGQVMAQIGRASCRERV